MSAHTLFVLWATTKSIHGGLFATTVRIGVNRSNGTGIAMLTWWSIWLASGNSCSALETPTVGGAINRGKRAGWNPRAGRVSLSEQRWSTEFWNSGRVPRDCCSRDTEAHPIMPFTRRR